MSKKSALIFGYDLLMPTKLTSIISQFREIHGDKYDYSLVEYSNAHTKVKIICPEHGEFLQRPGSHKSGHGCPKCKGDLIRSIKRNDQDYVITRFKEVHGDKYDYSLVKYVQAHAKVKVVCPEHGEFILTPNNHRQGQGCSVCGGRKITTDSIVKKFKELHGERYDYSLTEYESARSPVKIVCKKHGIFEQLPLGNGHLGGGGCPYCAYEAVGDFWRLSQDEVIAKFKAVHGDRYDYSLVKYTGGDKKVKIICSIHGEFEQESRNHKRGAGCVKCHDFGLLSREQVIESFKAVHGDHYDYSLVDYKLTSTPVKIICPDHGIFEQTPTAHKRGNNCPGCVGGVLITQEQVIEGFEEAHDNRYDYSEVEYVSAKSYVTIICKDHGPFQMWPSNHKTGQNCPECAEYGFNKGKPAILYYLKVKDTDLRKIGITNRTVTERFNNTDLKLLEVVNIWSFKNGHDAWDAEQFLLKYCEEFKYEGPPILSTGNSELFAKDILGTIEELLGHNSKN